MFQKKIWDNLWAEKEFSDWDSSSQNIYDSIIKEAGKLEGKKILEAGSGTGRISLRFAMEGADVTLLDFSEIAIEQSKERFNKRNLKAEFITCDIMNMKDIPDNTYDVVWNAGVLEHFDKNQLCSSITEMKRILKPDGILITINPNAKCLLYRIGKWYMEKTNQWSYGQELPIYTLKEIGEELGLSLLDEYSIGFKESLDFFSFLPESQLVRDAFGNGLHNYPTKKRQKLRDIYWYLSLRQIQLDEIERKIITTTYVKKKKKILY
ncbi:class I SAM-dependent methyltransferase [Neobacillus pocheonensis]|uniref:Class I SAM-dependent methyltransferase n=1 Tax=Neobacillus pocheonensis TaxID=363869 RepID=A0ABT0W6K6_9BACI|nr:class I SAM-dependent methyltransferase [Neobacillus pocheonensis]